MAQAPQWRRVPEASLEPDDLPDLYALTRRWRHEEAELRSRLRTLSDAELGLAPPGDANLLLSQYLVEIVMQGVAQAISPGRAP